jgi:NADH-quinone oxidoreductase subunit L
MTPELLLAIPAVPAGMAALLGLFGHRLPYNLLGALATLAAAFSFAVGLGFISQGVLGAGAPIMLNLGSWLHTDAFQADISLRLDSVALCMVLLVSGFGSLITLYSVGYMRHDQEQHRFFASLNLFVASMLVLVLADNLVLIFLGWEGVGLCSYLLVGHYWEQDGVPLAAFRAFFVNRIGDIFFLLGVFTLFVTHGTISLSQLAAHGSEFTEVYPWATKAAALLLLGGAFAKSAQAPLHVWLPDAMAGPTPVSALIHAATMVTAGIYLIMRLDWLFAAAPEARMVLLICALVTLVVGATLACVQTDIKKILAYSTLSNLALMFLALSASASDAAMLHLFGHAFFKALLFLAAGSVIFAAHHEQDVRRLTGSLKHLPVTYAAFVVGIIGGAGLIPYLSAGFFTKEAVLFGIEEGQFTGFGMSFDGKILHYVVLGVESLAAVYLGRLFGFLTGEAVHHQHEAKNDHDHHSHDHGEIKETSWAIRGVLAVLIVAGLAFAVFSALPAFGGNGAFYSMVTGGREMHHGPSVGALVAPVLFNLVLFVLVYLGFRSARRRESLQAAFAKLQLGQVGPLTRKWYFDDVYAVAVIAPLKGVSWILRIVFESIFMGVLALFGMVAEGLSWSLRRFQTGKAHQYAMGILVFAVIFGLMLFNR